MNLMNNPNCFEMMSAAAAAGTAAALVAFYSAYALSRRLRWVAAQ